jgi:gas vesicle structural protein
MATAMQQYRGGSQPYRGGSGYVARSSSSGLYDVLELILDKGLVIDVFVRVSLIGIEILTVDARIVIASVDTYLRFAEAVNRLDLMSTETQGLPEMMEGITESGASSKTKGALQGAREALFGGEDGDKEKETSGSKRRSSSSSSSTRRRKSSS